MQLVGDDVSHRSYSFAMPNSSRIENVSDVSGIGHRGRFVRTGLVRLSITSVEGYWQLLLIHQIVRCAKLDLLNWIEHQEATAARGCRQRQLHSVHLIFCGRHT
jgi:hypothetical protein